MRLEKGSQDLMQETVGYSCLQRANEPSAAGREDAREHAAACYHQLHLGSSPAGSPPPARRVSAAPRGSRAVLQLGPVRFRPRFCRRSCPALRVAVLGAAGLPWVAAALLCCAPPLWHVLGLLKELSAAQGRPSFQHASWAPVILYPLRSAHFHFCPCRLVPLELPAS